MKSVVTAILGGGQGARLWPLTRDRAKPAVPVAGKFRLIDVAISNSLHARIDQIFVLTQFNSASLHRHIAQTYHFDVFSGGFVNILAAEQNLDNRDWYQGTADAVRQNLKRFLHDSPSEILILSGDQLYLMDLRNFVESHRERQADLTIAVKPVSPREASAFGIMRLDATGRIVDFVEKPQDPKQITELALDAETVETLQLDAEPGSLLASMGIYAFRSEVLRKLLRGTGYTDFGKEVIPAAIHNYRVFGHLHRGYWRDIGTIPSFHQANLELTQPVPSLNLYSPDYPVYTHPRFLPGCKVSRSSVQHAILCDGSILLDSSITSSIVGVRAIVRSGSTIENSIIMGATHFEGIMERGDRHPMGIGRECQIRGAIVDLDARIGDGSKLLNEAGVENADDDNWAIRDGIIVVPRGAEVPAGTVI